MKSIKRGDMNTQAVIHRGMLLMSLLLSSTASLAATLPTVPVPAASGQAPAAAVPGFVAAAPGMSTLPALPALGATQAASGSAEQPGATSGASLPGLDGANKAAARPNSIRPIRVPAFISLP